MKGIKDVFPALSIVELILFYGGISAIIYAVGFDSGFLQGYDLAYQHCYKEVGIKH